MIEKEPFRIGRAVARRKRGNDGRDNGGGPSTPWGKR